jgi:hypothetical protein
MDPSELVRICEILNPENKAGRLTVIVRMGAHNLRQKLPHLIQAVRQAGMIVTWVSDPMHGNSIIDPASGLKTRPFQAILVSLKYIRLTPATVAHQYISTLADQSVERNIQAYGRIMSLLTVARGTVHILSIILRSDHVCSDGRDQGSYVYINHITGRIMSVLTCRELA